MARLSLFDAPPLARRAQNIVVMRHGGQAFLDLVIEDSHSCYLGDRSHRHAWGYGCGDCPACQLRAQGFAKFMSRRTTT
jgi:7-cyano-7-deazaguanine synthase in queuosine biosynthesis